MPEWLRLPPAAALALGLVPGLLAALWAREIVRRADEPGTPERLLAYRARLQKTLAVTIALLAVLATRSAPWTVPFALAAARAGAFEIRKRVFQDERSFGAYMLHGARVALLVMAFWVALATAPWSVAALPFSPRISAVLVGALLVLWHASMPRLVRFAFRMRPLEDAATLARLENVWARSKAPRPEILRGGPPGARWANALALPSLERPAVFLSDGLLAELAPDEVDAIFAHEVAHLEHYDRRRLVGGKTSAWLAIGLACLLGIAMRNEAAPTATVLVAAAWGLFILVWLVVFARKRQAHEAESDRRAAALCGDAEALVRALSRIHALAKVPRRWSADLERRATHPSLARRIRALRALSQAPPDAPPSAAAYASRAAGRWIVFAEDRIHFLEGVPEDVSDGAAGLLARARGSRSVRYDALSELRLAASRGGLSLVGRETEGRPFSMPVRPEDVARLQLSLDSVDGLLSAAPPAPNRLRARAVSAIALVASLLPAAIGSVAVPALLSIVFPSRAALAALSAASLAASGLVLRRRVAWAPWLPGTLALVSVLAAAVAFIAFLSEPRAERPRASAALAWVLALSILVAAAPLLFAFDKEHAAVGLHLAARAHPGLVVLLVAGAGALLASSGRSARWTRRLLAAAALAPLLFGSRLFLVGANDPLAFTGREAAVVERATTLVKRDPIDFLGTSLRLSPDAARWALKRAEDEAGAWVIGDFHGGRQEILGEDLRFLDAHRVLVVSEPDRSAAPELRVYDLGDTSRPAWTRSLPRLGSLRLDVNGARYRVTGVDFAKRELVRVSGEAGGTRAAESRWSGPSAKKGVPLASWAVGDGEDVVDIERVLAPRSAIYAAVEDITPWHSELWTLRGKSPRRLASTSLTIRCLPKLAPDATCLTVTPEETYLWSVDARAGTLAPLASVPGRALEETDLDGGKVALWMGGARLLLVDARTRRAELLKLPSERAWGVSLAASDELLGVLVQGGDGRAVVAIGH